MTGDLQAVSANASGHEARMDANYRLQRHIYDLTRRFYLLGRIKLIERLRPPEGGTVLELGCGTAWNLIRLAQRHPSVRFEGLDASKAMLETAGQKIAQAGFAERIHLRQGLAESAHRSDSPTGAGYDVVFFSYALSMIPGWREALVNGLELLRPGGVLAVVDFGDQAGLPRVFRRGLRAWLKRFHTEPRDALPAALRELARDQRATVRLERPYGRYALLALLELPEAAAAADVERFDALPPTS